MAFDQATRNQLQRFVSEARTLLTKEFTRQLQEDYGITPNSGEVAAMETLSYLDNVRRETARILRVTLEHYRANSPGSSTTDLLERIVREQAFTVLNRLAALRMAEAREFITESIAKGYESRGFQLYIRLAGTGLGETGDAYRSYLFSLFDEFALDLRVLFDRFSTMGRLFPNEPELLKLLKLMNDPEIADLWAEDETIGWIYQYFNSKDERKKMRDESAAPCNSRELAVRNQFFTPRYVVEFLTDNTLGRIWYEMTQGETALKDRCRYLVRRPTEIFLQEGAVAPESPEAEASLSQEELLRQPVYIPHRSLKDPREIRMLDPACGSMHFGLYAFDLYECIYDEAWDLEERGIPFQRCAGRELLTATYASKDAFLRDVPRLIIEHNIHGVDIDPRAVQIAGLSLWLRAQKSWQGQELKLSARPQIQKSNVVCAEQMPGAERLLNEFLEQHLADTPEQQLVGHLVRRVFEAMKLAGEAGSLLQIEQEISKDVEEARLQWLNRPKSEQLTLSVLEAEPKQQELPLMVGEITDEYFWERVEGETYKALNRYAEQAENGNSYQRRLFANDAVRGFAFVDLCRKKFDVVLMNPPFGESSIASRSYLYKAIESSTQDLFAAFAERFAYILALGGRLGIISNRLALFKDLLEDWRYRVLLGGSSFLSTVADLGYGVLDGAVVEAAAYVVSNLENDEDLQSTFFTVLDTDSKDSNLLNAIKETARGHHINHCFRHKLDNFRNIPGLIFAYWCSDQWFTKIGAWSTAKEWGLIAKKGLETGDDFRFLRLVWEVNSTELAALEKWTFYSKGGAYRPFHSDLHLVFDWRLYSLARRTSNNELYGRPGLTYTERTTSNFAARVLPANSLFSPKGPGIFPRDDEYLWGLLGFLNSRVAGFYIELFVGGGDTSAPGTAARDLSPTLIEKLPVPENFDNLLIRIGKISQELHQRLHQFRIGETSPDYAISAFTYESLYSLALNKFDEYETQVVEALKLFRQVDESVQDAYNLSVEEKDDLKHLFGRVNAATFDMEPSEEKRLKVLEVFREECGTSFQDYDEENLNRSATKLSFIVDARYENLIGLLNLSGDTIASIRRASKIVPPLELTSVARDTISYTVGCIFGRWDVQFSNGEKVTLAPSDPFETLPLCSPGMLKNSQGFPAEFNDISSSYPIHVNWSGVLVDDEGHSSDIVHHVSDVLRVVWGEKDNDIEQEVCEILKVNSLRDYLRKPAAFFNDHLTRYSKSRRQAPIYLPLSTASGSYTPWLYYYRLTDQTLYTCINDYVEPKLNRVSETVKFLRSKTTRTRDEENNLEDLQTLEDELTKFRDELLRVAKLPWKPNLNDGVQITVAPLHSLFRLSKWQKKLKETWDKLEKGDYDWAHLAHSIWTARVREKCRTDKSLAIAHGLEDLYEPPPETPKRTKRKKKE